MLPASSSACTIGSNWNVNSSRTIFIFWQAALWGRISYTAITRERFKWWKPLETTWCWPFAKRPNFLLLFLPGRKQCLPLMWVQKRLEYSRVLLLSNEPSMMMSKYWFSLNTFSGCRICSRFIEQKRPGSSSGPRTLSKQRRSCHAKHCVHSHGNDDAAINGILRISQAIVRDITFSIC